MSTIRVESYQIIGTRIRLFHAWEPSSLIGPHATVQRFDGQVYGQIGTRRPEVDPSLQGMEKVLAIRKAYADQAERAHELIREAHPEIAETATFKDGEAQVIEA